MIRQKGTRNLIYMTRSATSLPNTLSENDESITDPIKLANILNNFFNTIAKAKSKIKFSKKNSDSLKTKNLDIFSTYAATKEMNCNNFLHKPKPNNLIYPLQFGFRKIYSTVHALIHLTNLISESLDNGKFL